MAGSPWEKAFWRQRWVIGNQRRLLSEAERQRREREKERERQLLEMLGVVRH